MYILTDREESNAIAKVRMTLIPVVKSVKYFYWFSYLLNKNMKIYTNYILGSSRHEHIALQ